MSPYRSMPRGLEAPSRRRIPWLLARSVCLVRGHALPVAPDAISDPQKHWDLATLADVMTSMAILSAQAAGYHVTLDVRRCRRCDWLDFQLNIHDLDGKEEPGPE